MFKKPKLPRLHSSLLEPVRGTSITRKEYRQKVGSRTHLSKESLAILAKDAKDYGVLKQKGIFGRMEFSKQEPMSKEE